MLQDSENDDRGKNLFSAAKQLADSEINLIKVIEGTRKSSRKLSRNAMSISVKNGSAKKTTKASVVRPSASLLAAKREGAAQRKLTNGKKNGNTILQDIYQKTIDSQLMIRGDTGIVYDDLMAEHKCLWDSFYPECPERLTRVLERCETLGLLNRCKRIETREATHEEILFKHDRRQIDILKSTEGCDDETILEKLSSKYDSVYIHPTTYKLSLMAAGSTIDLLDNICNGKVQNGMAIIRPPGHHAMKSEYCGYCFFNNVAIAVDKMLRKNLAKKILIVDWDVHHGQATQKMFYDDPRVVYFSIHRYEHGKFWPNLKQSDYNYIGNGKGEGYNFNVPLNKIGMTDADYIAIFQQLLLPMAYEFQPDLVIVSAGYDAALGCPEFCPDLVVLSSGFDSAIGDEKGEMKITPVCYAHLLSSLMSLACGKIAVILEGGYCLKSLAEGAALTLRTLLGDPCPIIGNLEIPSNSIQETILNVIYVHKLYWNCYQYQDTYSYYSSLVNNVDVKTVRHIPTVIFRGEEETKSDKVYETRNCYPIPGKELTEEIDKKLNLLIELTNLSKAIHKVCIIYDDRMLNHINIIDNSHPEKPERISGIYSKHEEYGLLKRCHQLKGRIATEDELSLAHTESYIDTIKKTSTTKLKDLTKQSSDLRSVYLHTETWNSACVSVGSLLETVDSVMKGESQSGLAIVRPPGHHANENSACGFCIFNNVAVASRYAVKNYHLKRYDYKKTVHLTKNFNHTFLVENSIFYKKDTEVNFACRDGLEDMSEKPARVLIVDWDIHHGNGTQSILENDPNILYISIHRYDNGSFFPNSKKGNYTVVGNGIGEGYNVNIPWNKKGMGDSEYIAAFQQIVMPIAYQFNPELVLVSAGFDACVGDPLGGFNVSPEVYGHLTHWLSSLANGRVILTLEGGYNVSSISWASLMCTKALLGDPLPIIDYKSPPCTSAINTIKNVIKVHKKYWNNLIYQVSLPKENLLTKIKGYDEDNDDNDDIDIKLEISINNSESKIDIKDIIKTVNDNEIDELENDIENMKIDNDIDKYQESILNKINNDLLNSDVKISSCKNCVNPYHKPGTSGSGGGGGGGNDGNDQSSGTGGSGGVTGNNQNEADGVTNSLMNYLSENMQALVDGEMFAVVPLRDCPHLPSVEEVPSSGIDVRAPCTECDSTVENWICLRCYTVHCARSVNQHAVIHGQESEHPLTLSFSDISVWCYGCEAYIDNPRLYAARNSAHRSKFNQDLPWTYNDGDSQAS